MLSVVPVPHRVVSVVRARWHRSVSFPMRVLIAALTLMLLGACASAPVLRSEVVRFHTWQADPPLTFTFRRTPAQAASLEARSYEALVRERLVGLGLTEADDAGARYQVAVDWQATTESRRVTDWSTPFGYGPWGYGGWGVPRGYYGPAWRYDPWWGMPPIPVSRDLTVVRHELRVDLFDVRVAPLPGRKVHEARAVAYADGESFPRLMPGLVGALFATFPGESGTTERVEAPLPAPPAAR
jgi:hypothetical protein